MLNFNVLKKLYEKSPMDFYRYSEDSTLIKSVSNTSLGYCFPKHFSEQEIAKVWALIRRLRRCSTILIFIFFIILLYFVFFPNYSFLLEQNLNLSTLVVLLMLFAVLFGASFISKTIFEYFLKKDFGSFEKTKFPKSINTDEHYYKIFKTELMKVGVLLLTVGLALSFGSPVKKAYYAAYNAQYKKVISMTSIGAVIFPILPDWYSLRGYANFQLGEFDAAIKDYDTAYQLSTDIFYTMNFDNKIYIKYYLKKYDSALKDLDLEIKNANGEERDSFLWEKAQFLYNIKHYQEALDVYNELLTKADEDSVFLLKDRLYLERAQLNQTLGNLEAANEDLINSGAVETLEEPLDYIPQPVLLLKEI